MQAVASVGMGAVLWLCAVVRLYVALLNNAFVLCHQCAVHLHTYRCNQL